MWIIFVNIFRRDKGRSRSNLKKITSSFFISSFYSWMSEPLQKKKEKKNHLIETDAWIYHIFHRNHNFEFFQQNTLKSNRKAINFTNFALISLNFTLFHHYFCEKIFFPVKLFFMYKILSVGSPFLIFMIKKNYLSKKTSLSLISNILH